MSINVTFNGANILHPGVYSQTQVNLSGGFPLAPTGIVAVVGEATGGPPGSAIDIKGNSFTSDGYSQIVATYKSGPIVDACKILFNPSADARVANGAQRVFIYKTNASTQATLTLATNYGVVTSQDWGTIANLDNVEVDQATAESLYTTTFNYMMDPVDSTSLKWRANGGAVQTVTVTVGQPAATTIAAGSNNVALPTGTINVASTTGFTSTGTLSLQSSAGVQLITYTGTSGGNQFTGCTGGTGTMSTGGLVGAPTAIVNSINTVASGLSATAGTDRILIASVAGTLALAIASNVVTITRSVSWDNNPLVGDTLQIPTGSVIAGGSSQNVGSYLITAFTNTTITAAKLGEPDVAGIAVSAVSIASTTNDLKAWAPVTLTESATTPAGEGASLELLDGGSTVDFSETYFGGTDRTLLSAGMISGGATLALSVVGSVGTFTSSVAYNGVAVPGDLLWVRPGSVLAGGSLQNVGVWRVTAVTATVITATKTVGTPITVAAATIVATTDLQAFVGVLSSSLVPLLNTSKAEAQVLITVNRQVDNKNEVSAPLGGTVALQIGYSGTTATLTISTTTLTTSVVGGTGANLSIPLASYTTINDLATFINAQTGYSCAAGSSLYGQLSPGAALDHVAAIGICSSIAGDKPGRVKKDAYDVAQSFLASQLVTFAPTTLVGLPLVTSSKAYLTGGVVGGTTAASAQAGLDSLQKVTLNSIVTLFSQDASLDILAGNTDPSSTYTLDAVNAGLKSHVLLMSNTKNRGERNGYASFMGSFAVAQQKAQNMASARVSLCNQQPKVLKVDGTVNFVQPWGMACIAAGMQAGAPVGEPMTYKVINISGLQTLDFDAANGSQSDTAIANGILFAEPVPTGGFRIVVGNTTYGQDANFVFNRISVLYAADTYAINLRNALTSAFIGVSNAFADATAIKNLVIATSIKARDAGLIVGDPTNGGNGFKNLVVNVSGNTATVNITISPAQGLDFILPSITLDNIRTSATG